MTMRQIRGTYGESFTFIPSYCGTVLNSNPRNIARYHVKESGRFKRVHATLEGFLNGYHSIIGVDGTFLKGQAKEMNLSRCYNQIFSLVIAAIEKETKDS